MRVHELHMIVGETVNEETGDHAELTSPASVNLDAIRMFYPRKPGPDGAPRVGTRITFADGGGAAFTATYDEVKALFTAH